VGVERALLDSERVGEVADRGAVIALLREEPGGVAGQLLPAWSGNVVSLTTVR
jgi:hypothetical protein